MERPLPPKEIAESVTDGRSVWMVPAHDMPSWVRQTFLEPDSRLFNQDHYHLFDYIDREIGFIWAVTGYESKGRRVIGQAEEVAFRCNKWQRMRQEQQLSDWFGLYIPRFIITLDAGYCLSCSDADFCSLVEHELYHLGHDKDKYGEPAFHSDTGKPKLKVVGHDVEEFIGVVRRYGIGHPEGKLAQLVEATKKPPEVAHTDIAHACGTCLKLVA